MGYDGNPFEIVITFKGYIINSNISVVDHSLMSWNKHLIIRVKYDQNGFLLNPKPFNNFKNAYVQLQLIQTM